MASEPICDLKSLDFSKPVYSLEQIREVNPQRFEMEQLSGIIHVDQSQHLIVGYKQLTNDEFWIRGHMPGFPLMPGVVQCEAAAQLGGFYARKYDLIGGDYLGFGGMDEVRFRKPRIGRNPSDPSKQYPIPARAVVKFKAGKEMKELVMKLAPPVPAK